MVFRLVKMVAFSSMAELALAIVWHTHTRKHTRFVSIQVSLSLFSVSLSI